MNICFHPGTVCCTGNHWKWRDCVEQGTEWRRWRPLTWPQMMRNGQSWGSYPIETMAITFAPSAWVFPIIRWPPRAAISSARNAWPPPWINCITVRCARTSWRASFAFTPNSKVPLCSNLIIFLKVINIVYLYYIILLSATADTLYIYHQIFNVIIMSF